MEEPLGRVVAVPGGGARIVAGPIQRMMLRGLLDRLESRIEAEDPTTVRLFPPARPDDPEAESEYRSMARGDLLDGRRDAIATVRATLDATELDAEQAAAWLGVLNDLRLVLGTEVGVTQDMEAIPDADDPTQQTYVEYVYLGWLVEQFVDVLSRELEQEQEPPAAG